MHINGITIFTGSYDELIDRCRHVIDKKQSGAIISMNPELFLMTKYNKELYTYTQSTLANIPDGIGMVWALRYVTGIIQSRITGIDLVCALFHRERGPYYFLGAQEDVIAKAVKLTQTRYHIEVCGYHHGYFSLQEEDAIVRDIIVKQPRYVLVGLGMPRQEYFLKNHAHKFAGCVTIAVGGSFDVISGIKKRAPQLFTKLHSEWLYRLLTEPQRIGRMKNLPLFVFDIMRRRRHYQ